MTIEIAIFAATASLIGIAVFSLLLPKVADHFKDMNYRLLKELIEIRDKSRPTSSEEDRFNRIISIRRKAYLERQEKAFENFYNERRIDELKKADKTSENLDELKTRKQNSRKHGLKFHKEAWTMFLVIAASSGAIVTLAALIARWIYLILQ